jgi:hypothetical protein
VPGLSARRPRRSTFMSSTWPCTLYQAVTRRSGRAWLFLVTLPSAYAPMARVMTDAWKRRSCRTMCVITAAQIPYLAMRSGRPGRAGPGSAGPPGDVPAWPGAVSAVMSPSFSRAVFPDRGPEGQDAGMRESSPLVLVWSRPKILTSGRTPRSGHVTRHYGFACSGRRDQHPQIVPGQDLDSRLLWPGQHGRAGECLRSAGRALISQVKLAACLPAPRARSRW